MMNKIVKELDRLEKVLLDIKQFKQQEPEGSLTYQKKGNEVFFYQEYRGAENNKWEKRYIKRENILLAQALAQKQYYAKLEPMLKKKHKLLEDFMCKYHPQEMEQVYDDLNEVRKGLVSPAFVSKEELLHKWITEEFESNSFHSENLRYETEQGELVRSKSEVIIANILYSHKEDILYKYERPLILEKAGNIKTIYPDFTILNKHTGRISYSEIKQSNPPWKPSHFLVS